MFPSMYRWMDVILDDLIVPFANDLVPDLSSPDISGNPSHRRKLNSLKTCKTFCLILIQFIKTVGGVPSLGGFCF